MHFEIPQGEQEARAHVASEHEIHEERILEVKALLDEGEHLSTENAKKLNTYLQTLEGKSVLLDDSAIAEMDREFLFIKADIERERAEENFRGKLKDTIEGAESFEEPETPGDQPQKEVV